MAHERTRGPRRGNAARFLAIVVIYFLTLLLTSPFYFQPPPRFAEGEVITDDIHAQTSFRYTTEARIREWEAERSRMHKRIYRYNSSVQDEVLGELRSLLTQVKLLDAERTPAEELLSRIRRFNQSFAFLTPPEVKGFVETLQDPRFSDAIRDAVSEAYEQRVVVDEKRQFIGQRKSGVAEVVEIDESLNQRRRTLLDPLSAPLEWQDWQPLVARKMYATYGSEGPPPEAYQWAETLLRQLIRPSVVYDPQATEIAYQSYRRPDLSTHYPEGSTVVVAEEGHVIARDEARLLGAHREAVERARMMRLGGHAVFVLLVFLIFSFYVKKFSRELQFTTYNVIIIAIPVLLALFIQTFCIFLADGEVSAVGYLFPAGAIGMLGVLLLDVRMALLLVTWGCLLFSLQVNLDYQYVIMGLFGGYTGVAALYTIRKRWEVFLASILIAIVNASVVLITSFIRDPAEISWNAAGLGAIGGICSFLVLAVLPVFERFGIVTDMQLLELTGLHHPLLRQLEEVAPGTWQHTLNVAKLAEAAATEIGVNFLLVRAGCYYHDIGKMKNPEYFTENQVTKEEKMKHASLKPQISTLVIKNHVKYGVEMAIREGLPRRIIDFIEQHHGRSVISYFYHKALEAQARGDLKETVRIEDYRYPGPKPQTIEAAIVMLADSVEATATAKLSGRSVKEDDIKQVVRTIVFEKFNDGQFDQCNLTMRDLTNIRETFVRVLKSRFHTRIDYPKKGTSPPKAPVPAAAPAPPPSSHDRIDKEPQAMREVPDSEAVAEETARQTAEKIPLAAQE